VDQTDVYSTNMFAREIQAIIRSHPRNESLFLYAPFEAVHGAASCLPDCNLPAGDLLQAPAWYIDQQQHIADPGRRVFAGMLGALDDALKNITDTLRKTGFLQDTLIIFTTDNVCAQPLDSETEGAGAREGLQSDNAYPEGFGLGRCRRQPQASATCI